MNILFSPVSHHCLVLLQHLKTSPLCVAKFHSLDGKYKLPAEYQKHTCLYIFIYSLSKADNSLFSRATFALWSGLFVIPWIRESIFLIPFAFKIFSTYFLSNVVLYYFYVYLYQTCMDCLPVLHEFHLYQILLKVQNPV